MTSVIAHRGASAAFAENTLVAFEAARRLGADGVELDVRRTRDGIGAVHHDAHLADGRLICELGAADLPDRVPTLGAALAACGGMEVNVEIKNVPVDPDFDPDQVLVRYVVDEVAALDMRERVVVSCFNIATIDRVREVDPELRTAWLVHDRGDPLALIARAAGSGHDGIHPLDRMVDERFVAAAHDAGLFVNVWTVDDPARILALAAMGVDGVITNVPDVARKVLGSAT